MNLLIVESPTKERTISKMLNPKDFAVKSSYGHISDLPQKSLGVDVEKKYKPTYIVLPRAKKNLASLNKLALKAKYVFLATDFDREGEAIAWHLIKNLKLDDDKIKRITFHEITKEAIAEAVKNPRKIDLSLVNAQQARRILDRLVGYKLSPLLWRKIASGLSAGRVQSVAVRLIVERENEIKKFVSQQYWTISVTLSKDGNDFSADLISKDGIKYQEQIVHKLFSDEYKVNSSSIKTKEQAEEIQNELRNLVYKVSNIIQKIVTRKPPAPFTTSTLQQDAIYKLGFSSKKTMIIAQSLYEGVDLPEGSTGLITYMRTDSVQVAKSAQQEALKYVSDKIGKDYLPEKPRIYVTKSKGAQEAHEAIRPTSVYRTPENIKDYLNEDQYKLYKLIWLRFLASQMSEAKYNQVTIEITAGQYLLKTVGKIPVFLGFLKLYDESSENSNQDNEKEQVLPKFNVEEILKLVDILPQEHTTDPPPRYNEASLIKTLEKHGIGRPSTYAPTVDNILNRRYVVAQDKRFYPTELGGKVNDLLKSYFNDIVDINFTAIIEEELDEIANGDIEWEKVIDEFYRPFSKKIKYAEEQIKEKQKPVLTDKLCPLCSSQMLYRVSRFGGFYYCSKWPQCKGKANE